MIDDSADGIGAAATRTGVDTLHADAGQGGAAFGTDQTFGPAVGRRADVTRQAGTNADPVDFSLLTVRSARIWIARIQIFNNRLAG